MTAPAEAGAAVLTVEKPTVQRGMESWQEEDVDPRLLLEAYAMRSMSEAERRRVWRRALLY